MERNISSRLSSFLKENIVERKAMFLPFLCVVTFMLVGYAAVDKEAPVIETSRIELPYGEEFDASALYITDNQTSRELLEVTVNTDSLDVNQIGVYTITVEAIDQFSNVATKVVTVSVVDNKGPEFNVLGSNEGYTIVVPVMGSEDITSYMEAVDNVEGDVTPFIETSADLDTSAIGFQTITLTVSDSAGNVTEETYEFAISDDEAPVIELLSGSSYTLNYGDKFDIYDIVDIYDNFDESLDIVVNGEVDEELLGDSQEIEITATDGSGNETSQVVTVTVKDIESPSLSLSKSYVEVKEGATFTALNYVSSASDNYDGNLTSSVTASSISTSSTGTKTVTYTVTDSSGNTTTKTLKVYVYDSSISAGAQSAVTYAKTKIGSPYVYGATGSYSFDCSGFTQWCFKQAGVSISRTAASQASGGTYVSRSNLQVGDLVFYSAYSGGSVTHVGIYVGNGMIIHCSSSKGVCYASLDVMNYVTARRY